MSRQVSMQFGKPGGVIQNSSGGNNWVLLWTNNAPTSTFTAQDVAIGSISGYSEFMIISRYNTSATYYQTYNVINMGVDTDGYCFVIYTYIGRRHFVLKQTAISFDVGQRQSAYNAWTNNNDYCIPVFIYAR